MNKSIEEFVIPPTVRFFTRKLTQSCSGVTSLMAPPVLAAAEEAAAAAAAMLSKVAESRGLSNGGSACRFVVAAARREWKCWCAGEAWCRPPQHEEEVEEEACWSCCVEGTTNPRGEHEDEDDAVAISKAMTRAIRGRVTSRSLNA